MTPESSEDLARVVLTALILGLGSGLYLYFNEPFIGETSSGAGYIKYEYASYGVRSGLAFLTGLVFGGGFGAICALLYNVLGKDKKDG